MERLLKITLYLVLTVLLISVNAHATVIIDDYIGSDNHSYGDIIGVSSLFDIDSAEVNLSGTSLTVRINTNFAGNAGQYQAYTTDGNGIGYGDLFLSSAWTPDLSGSPDTTINDNHVSGTIWTYGIALDNRWDNSGGEAALYELNGSSNDANALLSNDFMSGGIFRDGQEVAVDTVSSTTDATGETGTWDIRDGYIQFIMDITGTELLNGSEIAIHWGMTCANDVIEGSAPVPEPATMLLLGSGLIGLAGVGRKKFKKKSLGIG